MVCSKVCLLLLCGLAIGKASVRSPLQFSVIATSFDLESSSHAKAIGHFNLSLPTSVLEVDVPNYQDWARLTESGVMGPWQYVTIAASLTGTQQVTLYDIKGGNHSGPHDLGAEVQEVHCSPDECYGIDVNAHKIVHFDPRTGKAPMVWRYEDKWQGCVMDASALDVENKLYYLTLVDPEGLNQLVVADLQAHTITEITGSFAADNSGPYCYDHSLGLVSLGSSSGGIVALNTTTSVSSFLRKEGLGGIPTNKGLDCSQGILVVGVIDAAAEGSPTLLLAFDLLSSDQPFHNSTATPGFHCMDFADRSAVRDTLPRA